MDYSKNTHHLSHIQLHARLPSTPTYLKQLKNVAYPYRVRIELILRYELPFLFPIHFVALKILKRICR